MILGYARVSTAEQNTERQEIALRAAGCETIYIDKASGKDFDRREYRRLMRKLKPGDTLIIKSIDRLGRNYEEILEQWRSITKNKQVAIIVLDMPLLNTRTGENLIDRLIADIVLQLLSYVAQTEREFIRQRQAEGIAAAKARGVQFGRKPIERTEIHEQAIRDYRAGEISCREAAQRCGVSHKTIISWAREEAI